MSQSADDQDNKLPCAGTFNEGNDGWLRGRNNELLLWVPPEYRPHLQLFPQVQSFRQGMVIPDFYNAAHGTSWADCFQHE